MVAEAEGALHDYVCCTASFQPWRGATPCLFFLSQARGASGQEVCLCKYVYDMQEAAFGLPSGIRVSLGWR